MSPFLSVIIMYILISLKKNSIDIIVINIKVKLNATLLIGLYNFQVTVRMQYERRHNSCFPPSWKMPSHQIICLRDYYLPSLTKMERSEKRR